MSDQSLIVCSVGDSKAESKAEKIFSKIKAENPDIFRWLGDTSYDDNNGRAWNALIDKVGLKAIMDMHKGNHEDDEEDADQCGKDHESWFKDVYDLAANNWFRGRQVKNAYFVSLNSQDLDYQYKDRDQYKKFIAEVEKIKQLAASGQVKWAFFGWHKPPYTLKTKHDAEFRARDTYGPVLDELAKIVVVFVESGHNHDKQLWKPINYGGVNKDPILAVDDVNGSWKPKGPIYMINGSGGRGLTAFKETWQNNKFVEYADASKYGYTKYTINNNECLLEMKDEDGAVLKSKKILALDGTVEPQPCLDNECKDPTTQQCRPIGADEEKDSNGFCKKKDVPDVETKEFSMKIKDHKTGEIVNILDQNTEATEDKVRNYTIMIDQKPNGPENKVVENFVVNVQGGKPQECPEGQCKDRTTQQCRPIGLNEEKGPDGYCKPTDPGGNEEKINITGAVASVQDAGKEASKAIDGSFETRWSGNGKGAWIELAFPKIYKVTKVALTGYWYDKEYRFSINGKDFINAAGRPANTLQEYDLRDQNIESNKLRIVGNGNSASDYNSYRKIEVYGIPSDGGPGPDPGGEAVAKLTVPDKVEPGSTNNKSSAEGSVYDTIEHSVTSSENIVVRDISPEVKEFDVPDKENFSVSSNLKVTKGSSVKQVSKQTTVQRSGGGTPGAKLVYDSNTDGKWNNGQKRLVKTTDGNIAPNGKGLATAASGDPSLDITGNEVSYLESSRWGRIYIFAIHYNFKLEGFFMFETDHGEADNISIKLRSRHGNNNHPQGGSNQFGGLGFAFHPSGQVEIKAEITHGGSSFDFGNLNGPALKVGEWHKYTISGFDEGGGITVTVAIDDQNIGSKKWANPHATAKDKTAFAADSYFWIRLNCHDGKRARAGVKNLKLYELT